jgi:hypothetical protein
MAGGYFPQGIYITRAGGSFPKLRASGISITQAASPTLSRLVPNATVAAVTETITAVAQVGGTGAAAGGWDTAVNRDTSIAAINETKVLAEEEKVAMNALIADTLALKQALTSIVDALQAAGMAS